MKSENGILSRREMDANMALIKSGAMKSQITKAEAYRRYSRKRIDRWISEEKIKPIKSKGLIMLSVSDLEAQSKTVELYEKIS